MLAMLNNCYIIAIEGTAIMPQFKTRKMENLTEVHKTEFKIVYEVKHVGGSFSPTQHDTIEEAHEEIDNFCAHEGEEQYVKYWESQRKNAIILKREIKTELVFTPNK